MRKSRFVLLFALFFLALSYIQLEGESLVGSVEELSPISSYVLENEIYLQVDKLTQVECGEGFVDKPIKLLSGGNLATYHHCTKYSTLQSGKPYITNSYIKVGALCEDRDGDGQEDLSTSANVYTLNNEESGIFLCYTTSQTASTNEMITSSTFTSGICPSGSDQEELKKVFRDANGNIIRHCVKTAILKNGRIEKDDAGMVDSCSGLIEDDCRAKESEKVCIVREKEIDFSDVDCISLEEVKCREKQQEGVCFVVIKKEEVSGGCTGSRMVEVFDRCEATDMVKRVFDGCGDILIEREPRLADLDNYYLNNPFKLYSESQAGIFDVLVVVDKNSYAIDRQELEKVLMYADKMLYDITGVRTHYLNIIETEFPRYQDIEFGPGVYLPHFDFVRDYLKGISKDKYPEGLIVFYKDTSGFEYGGYTTTIFPQLPDYCNEYGGFDYIYGGLIDWKHIPGGCGYELDLEELIRTHVSDVSFGGQCINQKGTQCILREGVYWCENLINHPDPMWRVKQDLAYFNAGSIIHEYMHFFFSGLGHAGTPGCKDDLIENPGFIPDGFRNLEERYGFYDSYGMCETAYYRFSNSLTITCDKIDREAKVFRQGADPSFECINGCTYGGECLLHGERTDGLYCDLDNNEVKEQKGQEQQCVYDFECITNICEGSKCA